MVVEKIIKNIIGSGEKHIRLGSMIGTDRDSEDKRKITAYNLHIKKEMLKGKSMKEAAASWRG